MIELTPCAESHRWQIHEWRNLPEVRGYMYTTDVIDRATHDEWYSRLLVDPARRGFVVEMDDLPVGAAFITDIDPQNKRATWAFYLADPATRGRGVGGAVEFLILEYAFETLNLHKLCCEVLSFNAAVVAMHKKFGFVEEGVLREHWRRDTEWLDTHVLAMFAETWAARRGGLADKLRSRALIS